MYCLRTMSEAYNLLTRDSLPCNARSAKRGIAIVSCPSVRLSVTLTYHGHIGWTSSKLITRIISLGIRSSEPQQRQSSPKGIPLKFGWNRGWVALLRKPAISLKRGKIGPRLLLMTYRKHTRFLLVPKSMTLDDLEGSLRTLFENTCVFRSPPRKVEWR